MGEFLLEPALLIRITGGGQAVRQGEEALLLLLSGFKARLDELDKDPVGAGMARFCQRPDATGSARGKAYASADRFLDGSHDNTQYAPGCTAIVGEEFVLRPPGRSSRLPRTFPDVLH